LQPLGRDSVDAHVEIGIVLSLLERWAEAQRVFEELLQRSDLTPSEQIECKARLGYVLVEQKIYARAEAVLNEALAYFENVTKTPQLDTNNYVAMSNYYLANIPHRQARVVELRVTGPSGDEQLHADILTKRELIKLAYDRYLIALRRRNAYWATASGYQMSQMFKEFWDDLVLAPVPPHLDAREAGFYVKEVHKQSRELLSKALYGHTQTVELAEAYRTSTEWSEASRIRAQQISAILARESGGELVQPGAESAVPKPGPKLANPDQYVPGRVEL
jgi:tetratricopeptide (TPR) repeat protein